MILGNNGLPEYFNQQLSSSNDPEFKRSLLRQISQFISVQDLSKLDTKLIDEIEGRSRMHVSQRIVKAFAEKDFESVDHIEIPERFTVYLNPQEIVSKLSNYRKLKNYYRNLALELKQEGTPLSRAKYCLLQIHRRKLNELMASSYSTAINLVSNGDNVMHGPSSPDQKAEWRNISRLAMDYVQAPLTFTDPQKRARNFSRMDKLRHGAGISWEELAPQIKTNFGIDIDITRVNPSDLSPISQEVLDLIIQGKRESEQITDYRYQSIDRENLNEVMVDSSQLISLFKIALQRQNLLSSDEWYDSQRNGRASDDLWQVVPNPKKNSMSVNAKQGVVKVGANYAKKLREAVPILAHEGVHVMQNELQRIVADLALSNTVGIKSPDIMEAGAKTVEEKIRQELFGMSTDSHNTDYLMAQLTKMAGGSFLDCMKAWFDSHCQRFPDKDKLESATDAFDRTLRIFRSGGDISSNQPFPTNTKDLVYTEQNLVVSQLRQQGLEFLIYLGMDAQTFLTLEKGGFINRNDIKIPDKNFVEIILDKIDEMLDYKPNQQI